ncbi:MAG: ThuA domain-containing protein [Planctomycetales bacterium]
MLRKTCLLSTWAWLAVASLSLAANPSLKALIVDGQNNHNWKATTPVLTKILEDTGLFKVDVATSPGKGQDNSDFQPKFSDYDVVVSNYNGQMWSKDTQKAFVDYVKGGGGVLVVHAANNAFTGWPEYNEMIGLGWRNNKFGERLTLDDGGKKVRTPKGEGPGAGHGPQHDFQVVIRDPEHAIMQGLPQAFMHAKDELYHGQRGPALNMHVLATAYSAADKRGTGSHEPMVWIIPHGKGHVITNVMGHSDYSMTCSGFQTILQRSAEWAATGKVKETAKIPADFPKADAVTVRPKK